MMRVDRDLRRALSQNVNTLRCERGLTFAALSARAAMHARHLQKIVDGRQNVTLSTVAKLAAALSIEPVALLTRGQP